MIRTLSGFLGLPSDWDFLPWSHRPFDDGASEEDILIGYSMGGRLALQILESRRFVSAVIVSAGLNAPDDERRTGDEEWARRFGTEEWASLMRAWSSQPVFGGHQIERREEDYDRANLVRALREYSPAVLPPPQLERIDTPILWVAGERDSKYVDVGRRAVERLPNSELWICPRAGHRVPWEQRDLFLARLGDFIGDRLRVLLDLQ